MRTTVHTTVQLGDLVKVAFDWAAQCSSDPRDAPLLAAKAVEYLLRRARKTSASRQAPALLPRGAFRELLTLESAGRRSCTSASTDG